MSLFGKWEERKREFYSHAARRNAGLDEWRWDEADEESDSGDDSARLDLARHVAHAAEMRAIFASPLGSKTVKAEKAEAYQYRPLPFEFPSIAISEPLEVCPAMTKLASYPCSTYGRLLVLAVDHFIGGDRDRAPMPAWRRSEIICRVANEVVRITGVRHMTICIDLLLFTELAPTSPPDDEWNAAKSERGVIARMDTIRIAKRLLHRDELDIVAEELERLARVPPLSTLLGPLGMDDLIDDFMGARVVSRRFTTGPESGTMA